MSDIKPPNLQPEGQKKFTYGCSNVCNAGNSNRV